MQNEAERQPQVGLAVPAEVSNKVVGLNQAEPDAVAQLHVQPAAYRRSEAYVGEFGLYGCVDEPDRSIRAQARSPEQDVEERGQLLVPKECYCSLWAG